VACGHYRSSSCRSFQLLLYVLAFVIGVGSTIILPAGAWADPPTIAGELCRDLYTIPNPAAASDPLPGDGTSPWGAKTPSYSYANPAGHLSGAADRGTEVTGLTGAALTKRVNDLTTMFGDNTKGKVVGTEAHLYAARVRYLKKQIKDGKPIREWKKWLNGYIPNQANDAKGVAKVQRSGNITANKTLATGVPTNQATGTGAGIVDPAGKASGAGDDAMTTSASTAEDAAQLDADF
jgi:hypothetical protein